jgi:hypothetical protein
MHCNRVINTLMILHQSCQACNLRILVHIEHNCQVLTTRIILCVSQDLVTKQTLREIKQGLVCSCLATGLNWTKHLRFEAYLISPKFKCTYMFYYIKKSLTKVRENLTTCLTILLCIIGYLKYKIFMQKINTRKALNKIYLPKLPKHSSRFFPLGKPSQEFYIAL